MSKHVTPIDISRFPDLIRIVEEMKNAKEPRILKQGDAPVAMLMPMDTAAKKHSSIEAVDFKSLDEVRAGFLDAGYSETEVQDMIEAMSELPQYAGQGIQKSHIPPDLVVRP
jgi:hypothetical protein